MRGGLLPRPTLALLSCWKVGLGAALPALPALPGLVATVGAEEAPEAPEAESEEEVALTATGACGGVVLRLGLALLARLPALVPWSMPLVAALVAAEPLPPALPVRK